MNKFCKFEAFACTLNQNSLNYKKHNSSPTCPRNSFATFSIIEVNKILPRNIHQFSKNLPYQVAASSTWEEQFFVGNGIYFIKLKAGHLGEIDLI